MYIWNISDRSIKPENFIQIPFIVCEAGHVKPPLRTYSQKLHFLDSLCSSQNCYEVCRSLDEANTVLLARRTKLENISKEKIKTLNVWVVISQCSTVADVHFLRCGRTLWKFQKKSKCTSATSCIQYFIIMNMDSETDKVSIQKSFNQIKIFAKLSCFKQQ